MRLLEVNYVYVHKYVVLNGVVFNMYAFQLVIEQNLSWIASMQENGEL